MNKTIDWIVDEQQRSFIAAVFELAIHDPVEITLDDIDEAASLSIGQNRTEMQLDGETVDILTLFMDDGISIPMPLVWRQTPKARTKYVVLDGNHRIAAALRKRGEASCPALLVTGESQLAQRLAVVVNTMHGRSTRDPAYVATAMRILREQGVPAGQIAHMFGVSPDRVGVITRRDVQLDRVRRLVPERRSRVPAHTLDLIGAIEDDHVKILGDLFIDAPKSTQDDYVRRMRDTASANRDALAHEIVGELREIERAKSKVRARQSRPASQLMGALQRLVGVTDPIRAFYASTDQQKAIMRANLGTVVPRLNRLLANISEQSQMSA